MKVVHLKVHLHSASDDQIRRFAIPVDFEWQAVKERVNRTLGICGCETRYVDQDGDQVLVSSQEDWKECLHFARELMEVHLHLNKLEPPAKGAPEVASTTMAMSKPVGDRDLVPGAREYTALHQRAMTLMEDCKYSAALEVLQKASGNVVTLNLYHMACRHALLGQQEEALRMLKESIAKGYNDLEQIKSDANLQSLRSTEEFQNLIRELRDDTGYSAEWQVE